MDRGWIMKKNMKLEIPSETDNNISSGGAKFQMAPPSGAAAAAAAMPTSMLTRQPSATKNSCLCSPTSHAGSFRCRLHRYPGLQRTKSNDSASTQDSTTKDD
uniref:Uncharacterized protein MANES_12G022500 n=1 Tax=Rhizophora mucronata TaxID=61149 RepID=A0A2P2PVB2_RHIMU